MSSRATRDPLPLRLAAWCLPAEVRDEVRLELREQYAHVRERRGRLMAWLWAWRQPLATAKEIGSRLTENVKRLPISLHDIAIAGRRLARTPLFALFAVITLALGIGATTGIYSIVHAALRPPTGIRNIEGILEVRRHPDSSRGLPLLDFEDFLARQTRLAHLTGWKQVRFALAAGGRSLTTFGELVSGSYFDLLGVTPVLGRAIQPPDERPGQTPVIVLGHVAWQRLFDGRSDAIGQIVSVNGHAFVVAGIAPAEFKGQVNNGLTPSAGWVPLSTAALFPYLGGEERLRDRDSATSTVRVQGRVLDGTSMEEVQAEATAVAHQLDAEVPVVREDTATPLTRQWAVKRFNEVSVNPDVDAIAEGLALAMMFAVGVILLVACSNLANLMLARGATRRHDIAVRLALGASRWRLTREGAAEMLLLVLAGGAAGIGVARVLLVSLGLQLDVGGIVLAVEPRMDLTALVVSSAATLLALVVAGILPAWTSARADVRGALSVDNSHAAMPRWRGRSLLITAQVAASVTLLALMTMFASQIRAQSRHESGLALDRLAMARIDFHNQNFSDGSTRQIVDAVLTQLTRRPGFEQAFVSTGLPVGTYSRSASVSVADTRVSSGFVAATPRVFDALGIRVLRGRAFDERDAAGTLPVAVINELAARQLFGHADVLGHTITVDPQDAIGTPETTAHPRTIIGIVSDSDAGSVGRRLRGLVFVPWSQQFGGRLVFALRTTGTAVSHVHDLRQAIATAAPDLAVEETGTGMDLAGPFTLFAQISAGISGLLGAFGMLLALVGLVGVLSHVVAARTREIGLRLALGATAGQVQSLILRDGVRPVGVGIMAGSALALIAHGAFTQLMPLLSPPRDFPALALLAVLLLAAGTIACYLPARRGSRVDPNVALRDL